MKIVLTGSDGYLGSNIKQTLSAVHNLKCVKLRLDTIESVKKDILDFNPDMIIHCGWKSGNSYNDILNIDQLENVVIGVKLLEILPLLDKVKFVGIGSFSEYGKTTKKSKESDTELPENLYGISKNSLKVLSENMCKTFDIDYLWLRPCYVYGKNDVKTRLIPKVVDACLNRKEIDLNSCKSVTDYLYIDDFCSAIKTLIEGDYSGVFNICSGKEYKVIDIIRKIQNFSGVSDNISFDSNTNREEIFNYICGDNYKLKGTGWKELYDIDSGILETLKFMEKY